MREHTNGLQVERNCEWRLNSLSGTSLPQGFPEPRNYALKDGGSMIALGAAPSRDLVFKLWFSEFLAIGRFIRW